MLLYHSQSETTSLLLKKKQRQIEVKKGFLILSSDIIQGPYRTYQFFKEDNYLLYHYEDITNKHTHKKRKNLKTKREFCLFHLPCNSIISILSPSSLRPTNFMPCFSIISTYLGFTFGNKINFWNCQRLQRW